MNKKKEERGFRFDARHGLLDLGSSPVRVCLCLAVAACAALTGCRTEYYPPVGNAYTKVDGKIYGPVQREGLAPWSDGNGKVINLPLSKLQLIGK